MSEIKFFDGGVGMPDAAFYNALESAAPYAATADRSYESDPAIQTGVPVVTGYQNITAGANPGTSQLASVTLAANTPRGVTVAIPAGANSQAVANTLREAGRKLGVELAKVQVAAIRSTTGIIELTLNLSRSDLFTCLIDVKTAMDERGCPAEGRVLVMPPALFGELAKDQTIKDETDIEVSGKVLKVMGFTAYEDEGLDGEMLIYHKDAVAVAQIATSYERTSARLDAWYLTGAVVPIPDHVCYVTVS